MNLISRRSLIKGAFGGVAASLILPHFLLQAAESKNIRAVAFDAFPVFDPAFVFTTLKNEFPETHNKLRALWFPKIFGYSWLRTAAGQYKPFRPLSEDALVQSCETLELDLKEETRKRIMNSFMALTPWPDVKPALEYMHARGIRLAFLSNMDEEMLRTNAKAADIEGLFEFYLSTDRVQMYKPAPEAYRMGVKAFDLPKEQIVFAAFAGWDAAGAEWFGYPTVWVNRLGASPEMLDTQPDIITNNIKGLTDFVLS